MLDVVDDPAGVAVAHLLLTTGTLVDEVDLEALVQEGHDLQPLDDRLRAEFDLFEACGIRPEADRRARPVAGGGAGHPERCHGLTTVGELENVMRALSVDLENETARKRVHDRDADTVEAARYLVSLATELATCVKCRKNELGGGAVRILLVRPDRDPTAVVRHAAPAVG